ncbi:MAG: ADP-ribosylglycohydrolase family protein [Chloroflexi bacterium]|nr:MAG: ADP-ribosylglycohydrolase family protein [Chloroflexota bacterium]
MKSELSAIESVLHLMDGDTLQSLLLEETQQRQEEGYDVAAIWDKLELPKTKDQLVDIYKELLNAPRNQEFSFYEPDGIEEIHAARPPGPRAAKISCSADDLYDRVYGGWLGRAAGCMLGKPVEIEAGWGKDELVKYLQLANSYPLRNYIPRLDPMPPGFSLNRSSQGCCLGEINAVVEDDDTDYTILALHILETYGVDFTTANVAAAWLERLPYHRTYTAERFTYRNLILGVQPEEASQFLNPNREFIGARIRIDTYGFAAPGKPELAARLAYRDSVLSHTKNGVYSAMFTAACIAWAFVTDDIDEIINTGLSEIPFNCRQAESIREAIAMRKQVDDWETAYERLLPKQAAYNFVHAINNTVWMVLALLYSGGDFEKAISIAVTCGDDTDCNGANAGAVMGILHGARNLPEKWTAPLRDTLYTNISRWREHRISELARRTVKMAENTLSKNQE